MALDVALAPLVSAFVGAAIVTSAATPLVARLAKRLGVVDQPGGRRIHTTATPRLGGVAVALGLVVGAVAYGLVFGVDALLAILTRDQLLSFLLPCLLVFLVGLVDDTRGLSPSSRLAVEAVAATFLVQGGYVIDNIANPFGQPIELGLFAMPFTIMWLVGVTNAFNLIDGLDGLLGSVSLAALLGIAAVAYLGDRSASGILAAALAGSVLGFLVWNWHPARIFMGDSGSLLVGFAIAGLSIKVARNTVGGGSLAFHVPLLLCGLPIAETLLTLARRHINGQPYFSGDRSHIHHVLLNKGLSVPGAVRSLAFVAGMLATVAVLSRNWREQAFLAGAVVILVLAVAALRWLGYLELQVLATRLAEALRPRRRDLARAVTVAACGEAIEQATSTDELQAALRQTTLLCRLSSLAVVFSHETGVSLGGIARRQGPEHGLVAREDELMWLFLGTSDEGAGMVTIEIPLFGREGVQLGRLVCRRAVGEAPTEREIQCYVSAPLRASLSKVLSHSLIEM